MIMISYNVLQKRLISQQINSPGEYALRGFYTFGYYRFCYYTFGYYRFCYYRFGYYRFGYYRFCYYRLGYPTLTCGAGSGANMEPIGIWVV